MNTHFKVRVKFDHFGAEMLEFCEDVESFTNIKDIYDHSTHILGKSPLLKIKDIYDQVQKKQDVAGLLKKKSSS